MSHTEKLKRLPRTDEGLNGCFYFDRIYLLSSSKNELLGNARIAPQSISCALTDVTDSQYYELHMEAGDPTKLSRLIQRHVNFSIDTSYSYEGDNVTCTTEKIYNIPGLADGNYTPGIALRSSYTVSEKDLVTNYSDSPLMPLLTAVNLCFSAVLAPKEWLEDEHQIDTDLGLLAGNFQLMCARMGLEKDMERSNRTGMPEKLIWTGRE